ncbi:hypothetical protein [Paenibacillus spongiae]|uniref:DUF4393 domain-containing protein n=1 Tax=Paenibacillus spongiae TaxID=2909671 RepID=A0ABY5S188_9BACL|nr:hypothetical protein [Paenibacillus spongiae]UVI27622.1 hypothetical protein L1F29_19335 [Paenibacillus spongiae]
MDKLKRKIKDIFDVGGEGTASIIGSVISDGVAGQILPGVTSAYMSYKQKRTEQNIARFAEEVKAKEHLFDERLSRVEETVMESLKEKYVGVVTEYAIDEIQEEKIKFLVNGLLSLSLHEVVQEDFVLTYYDTLRELRMADISVLKFYYEISNGTNTNQYTDLLPSWNLDEDQYLAVREKLARLGLLKTRRESEVDHLYRNVIDIQNFLEAASKGKSAKLARFKRLTKNDNYFISMFGRSFIEFFVNEEEIVI